MPSEFQSAGESQEYDTDAERMVATKPNRMLHRIVPMTEAEARTFVGACNKLDADTELTEHFVRCVKRAKQN